MQYSLSLLLALAGSGLASPAPLEGWPVRRDGSIDPAAQPAHFTAEINLDDYETSVNGANEARDLLSKRTNIKTCVSSEASAGVCVGIAGVLSQIVFGIAGVVKGDADAHDCSVHYGHIDNTTFKVYASGAQNCHTTAQLDTIAGSLTDYFKKVAHENVCGVHCLKMTHGGDWIGYVTVAPEGTNLSTFYCGGSNTFGNCVSGGKYDTP